MKIKKSVLPGVILLMICIITTASPAYDKHLSADEAISIYLNAVVHGKIAGIENAIAEEAEFSTTQGERVNTIKKSQVVELLKSGENIEQGCTCTSTTVQDNEEAKIIKAELKYADFTRVELIKAQPVKNGWKITRVETSFK